MLNPQYTHLIKALEEAETNPPKPPHQPGHTPTTQPRILVSPFLDDTRILKTTHTNLAKQAHHHCTHHNTQTTTEQAIPTLNTLDCNCPEKEQVITRTNQLLYEITLLLENPYNYQPFPCPHCDIIRNWNMSHKTTTCPGCKRVVDVQEAYRIGVSVARLRLQLGRLKNHLWRKQREKRDGRS